MIKTKTIQYENAEKEKQKEQTHYKLMILVIASHTDYYEHFKNCWKQYMNQYPDVKSFFLYSDPTIDSDLLISEDSITYRCEESYTPGILLKTIAGYDYIQKHFSYDFILRTNLSSFIHIPRFYDYLEKKPKNDLICCKLEHFPLLCDDETINKDAVEQTMKKWLAISKDVYSFEKTKEDWKMYTKVLDSFFGYRNFMENRFFHYFAGSFILFSQDVVQKIIHQVFVSDILSKKDITTIPDDIVLSAISQLPGIQPKNLINIEKYSHSCVYEEKPKHYTDDLFFIRNRTDKLYGNRDIDMKNITEQVKEFYGTIV